MKLLRVLMIVTMMPLMSYGNTVLLLSDQMGSSSRMIAVGNIEGVYSEAPAVFTNVAALMRTTYSFSMLQTQLADPETTVFCISGSMPFLWGHLGAGVMSMQSKNLDKTVIGELDQFYSAYKFGTKDSIYELGYQQMINGNTSVGVTMKYVDQDLYETVGTGFNVDAGVVVDTQPVRWSLSAKNIVRGSEMYYTETKETLPFPFQVCLGGRYQIWDLGIMSQIKYFDEGSLYLKSVGMEYNIMGTGAWVYGGWKEIPANKRAYNTYSVGSRLDLGGIALTLAYDLSQYVEQNSRYYFSFDIKL